MTVNNDNRIRVIIGHYGSGKTEFAVNYSLKLRELENKVTIADLDVVNPYFRTREKAEMLESKDIRVISGARGHSANLAIPMMSSQVLAPIQNESMNVILDVGGNSDGAKALGRYRKYLINDDYDMFCVLNAYRTETQTVEGMIKHIKDIEAVVGSKVTGLISNTHLLRETTVKDVLFGYELVKKVSSKINVPIKYISCIQKVAQNLPQDLEGEVFPIQMIMREEWM